MPERLVNRSTGELVGAPVLHATTALQRTRGLLGTRPGRAGVLVLHGARQVHTFGMTYRLDVIFCDGAWVVLHVVHEMAPARVTRWVRGARFAVELPSATRRAQVGRGDRLGLEPC